MAVVGLLCYVVVGGLIVVVSVVIDVVVDVVVGGLFVVVTNFM